MKEVKERIQPTNNKGGRLLKLLLTSSVIIGLGVLIKNVAEKTNTTKKARVYKALKT